MANNPKIEVEIGADIRGLQNGIAQADNAIDSLGKSSNQSAPQIAKLTVETNKYNSVAVNLSNVIQEAQFGFDGIARSVPSLSKSFIRASADGGEFGKILNGFLSSTNVVSIGITALTTAFLILKKNGFFETKISAEELNKTLKEYQENLKGVASATLKGAQDAQKEIGSLTALRLQIENTAVSQKNRNQAVTDLQNQYPSYFANLTKEQILNGDVGDAYINVTKALIAKAQAQASINKIAENSIKLLTVQTKLEEIQGKRLLATADAQGQIDILLAKRKENGFLNQGEIQRYGELIRSLNKATDSYSEEITLLTEKESVLNENNKLVANANKLLSEGVSFTKESNKELKTASTSLEDFSKISDQLNKQVFQKFAEDADLFNKELTETLRLQSQIASISESIVPTLGDKPIMDFGVDVGDGPPVIEIPENAEAIANFAEVYQQNSEQINETTEALIGGFSALGNQIASSLDIGNDALKGFIGTLLSNTPKIIQALFQQAAAKKAASLIENAANQQVASGEAVAVASKAANALGPIGLALLPVFVGGALAVISGAFKKGGGGGGGASGVGTSGISQGTNFTGQGQGATGFNRDLTLRTEIDMDRLVFYIDQAKAAQI